MLYLYSSGGASDFTIDGEALPADDAASILNAAIQLLDRRDKQAAARILADVPFVIYHGHNEFNDQFDVLLASVDMDEYERLRELHQRRGVSFLEIADTVSELGHYIRHIAVDLTLQPTTPRVGQPTANVLLKRESTFWTPGYFKLFLSHSSSIKKPASDLQLVLRSSGISAFVAHADIAPTREWEEEILVALETMDALAAILTEDFTRSKWCDQEVGVALGRGHFVLPVKVDLDPYGFIARTQAIMASHGPLHNAATPIAHSLLLHKATASKYTNCLAHAFEFCESYANAKSLISILESCSFISRADATKLVQAIDDNSQVRDAFHVPERVRALVRRLGYSDLAG